MELESKISPEEDKFRQFGDLENVRIVSSKAIAYN